MALSKETKEQMWKIAGIKAEDVKLDEKAVTQAQRRLMGMAYAYKKGDIDLKGIEQADEVKRIAKDMSLEELKKFAETKEKGLPKKVKESVEHEKAELERTKEEENHVAMIRKEIKSARAKREYRYCLEVFDKIEDHLKKLDELHAKAMEEDKKEVEKEEKK